jgi:hypothetical protein
MESRGRFFWPELILEIMKLTTPARPLLIQTSMITLTHSADETVAADGLAAERLEPEMTTPSCYSVTIFTQRWKEVRDFYVNLLSANVISERTERYCEMELGGIPMTLRQCEYGEMVSYFHLYISMKERSDVLAELRQRGIIVTTVGPYTNFRDPEGRVIKLSEEKMVVA